MQKCCTSCIKGADGFLKCPYCKGYSVKNGKSRCGKQRFHCKICKRYFLEYYTRESYRPKINEKIIRLLKEGFGISNLSRYLNISKTTVLRRIHVIAEKLRRPPVLFNQTYEIDEQWTYVKSKSQPTWIIYALCRETKQIVDFVVGSRTNEIIGRVVNKLVLSNPIKIYTDKLLNYRTLIPAYIHVTKRGGTNHIERQNLENRKDLKRLGRKTICYSKSIAILSACLKIYFWG